MRKLLYLACLATLPAWAALDADLVAARSGGPALTQAVDSAQGSLLESYPRYWALARNLDQAGSAEVQAFLQRYPDSVLAALRKWRNENPSKRPNPGHIVQMLKDAWGRKHADQTRAAIATPVEPPKERISDERRRAILAEAGLRDPLAAKTIDSITPSENPP